MHLAHSFKVDFLNSVQNEIDLKKLYIISGSFADRAKHDSSGKKYVKITELENFFGASSSSFGDSSGAKL